MGSIQFDQNQVQVYQHSKIYKITLVLEKIYNNNSTFYIHHVHRMHRLVEHYCPDVHIIGAKHLSAV